MSGETKPMSDTVTITLDRSTGLAFIQGKRTGKVAVQRAVSDALRAALDQPHSTSLDREKLEEAVEHCHNWIGDGRCGKPAEFIVWGKLFDPDALGPRCYDCAAGQIGHNPLRSNDHISYAVYRLPNPTAIEAHCREKLEALREEVRVAIGSLGQIATDIDKGKVDERTRALAESQASDLRTALHVEEGGTE